MRRLLYALTSVFLVHEVATAALPPANSEYRLGQCPYRYLQFGGGEDSLSAALLPLEFSLNAVFMILFCNPDAVNVIIEYE